MNFPGAAFWCPTTGSEAAVGRTLIATATASDATPITANATTALLMSNDRPLSRCGPVSASSS
jgi:hypothetical protein